MNISAMKIRGYRRFKDETITFCANSTHQDGNSDDECGTTILVGSNNSGKTSIVELVQHMLGNANQARTPSLYSADDFNIELRDTWLSNSRLLIRKYLNDPNQFLLPQEHSDDDSDVITIDESQTSTGDRQPITLVNLLQSVLDPQGCTSDLRNFFSKQCKEMSSPEIEVWLTVNYTEKDDIRNLSDYLLYFTEESHNVYFKYIVRSDANAINDVTRKEKFDACAARIQKTYDDWGNRGTATIENNNKLNRIIDEVLIDCFSSSLVEAAFYCDSKFSECKTINNISLFKQLFNCRVITARRDLDDIRDDHTHTLSSRLMQSVSVQDSWVSTMSEIQSAVLGVLDEIDYTRLITTEARSSLNQVIDEISQTNGGHADPVQLNGKITLEAIRRFLNANTVAQFGDNAVSLGEQSQGLGYSNLTLILIDFLSFMKSCEDNAQKINFLVIEEPESHMHPQMQSIFIRHVFSKMRSILENGGSASHPTCLITTHSTQIVQESSIAQMRILRPSVDGRSTKIIDLMSQLQKRSITGDVDDEHVEERRRFYEILFGLNFANIVFADKVILFEGDTERMYLQALIRESDATENSSKYSYLDMLRKQYISYVQVGGRYAFEYIRLLRILDIKSVIITDIDYPKTIKLKNENNVAAKAGDDSCENASTEQGKITEIERDADGVWKEKINTFEIDNPTLNRTFATPIQDYDKPGESVKLTVANIYQTLATTPKRELKVHELKDCHVAVSCQTDSDGYGRTLEEAMLCKLFNIGDVFMEDAREKWKERRASLQNGENSPSPFPMPKGPTIRVRDVVNSIADSNHKTDFMYAIILSRRCRDAIPRYIEDSLKWLAMKD